MPQHVPTRRELLRDAALLSAGAMVIGPGVLTAESAGVEIPVLDLVPDTRLVADVLLDGSLSIVQLDTISGILPVLPLRLTIIPPEDFNPPIFPGDTVLAIGTFEGLAFRAAFLSIEPPPFDDRA